MIKVFAANKFRKFARFAPLSAATAIFVFVSSCSLPGQSIEDQVPESVSASDDERYCDTAAWEGESEALTVMTNSGPHAAPYLEWADRLGCFEMHGLAVTVIEAGAPADRLASLVGGTADIAWLPTDPLVAAIVNGGIDLVIVSPHAGFTSERMSAAKEAKSFDGSLILDGVLLVAPGSPISRPRDLEGKVVGQQSAVSNIGVAVAVKEDGGNPDLLQAANMEQAERLSLLLRGDLDAASLSGVNAIKAMNQGAQFLFYYQAWDRGPGVQNFWVTDSDTAEKKRVALLRFRDAMRKVYGLLESPEAAGLYMSFVAEKFEISLEDAEAVQLPDFYLRQALPSDVEPHALLMYERGDIAEPLDIEATNLFSLN